MTAAVWIPRWSRLPPSAVPVSEHPRGTTNGCGLCHSKCTERARPTTGVPITNCPYSSITWRARLERTPGGKRPAQAGALDGAPRERTPGTHSIGNRLDSLCVAGCHRPEDLTLSRCSRPPTSARQPLPELEPLIPGPPGRRAPPHRNRRPAPAATRSGSAVHTLDHSPQREPHASLTAATRRPAPLGRAEPTNPPAPRTPGSGKSGKERKQPGRDRKRREEKQRQGKDRRAAENAHKTTLAPDHDFS